MTPNPKRTPSITMAPDHLRSRLMSSKNNDSKTVMCTCKLRPDAGKEEFHQRQVTRTSYDRHMVTSHCNALKKAFAEQDLAYILYWCGECSRDLSQLILAQLIHLGKPGYKLKLPETLGLSSRKRFMAQNEGLLNSVLSNLACTVLNPKPDSPYFLNPQVYPSTVHQLCCICSEPNPDIPVCSNLEHSAHYHCYVTLMDHWLATSGVSYVEVAEDDYALSSEVQEAWNAKPNVGSCPVCRSRHLEPEHALRLRKDCLTHACKDWLETYNPQEDYDRILANQIQDREEEQGALAGSIFPHNEYDSDYESESSDAGSEYLPNPFEAPDPDSGEEDRAAARRVEEDILNTGFIVDSDDDTYDF